MIIYAHINYRGDGYDIGRCFLHSCAVPDLALVV